MTGRIPAKIKNFMTSVSEHKTPECSYETLLRPAKSVYAPPCPPEQSHWDELNFSTL